MKIQLIFPWDFHALAVNESWRWATCSLHVVLQKKTLILGFLLGTCVLYILCHRKKSILLVAILLKVLTNANLFYITKNLNIKNWLNRKSLCQLWRKKYSWNKNSNTTLSLVNFEENESLFNIVIDKDT